MTQAKGTIKKIKVISPSPHLMVRFSIETNNKTIHCISADNDICQQVLLIPEGSPNVAVYGQFNTRNQLIIQRLHCEVSPTSYFQMWDLT